MVKKIVKTKTTEQKLQEIAHDIVKGFDRIDKKYASKLLVVKK